MSNERTIFSSFYKSLPSDVTGFLSTSEAVGFTLSCDVIAEMQNTHKLEEIVITLTQLGKELERAIVTGSRFNLPVTPIPCGCNDLNSQLPSLFTETFSWFFRTNGENKVRLTYLPISDRSSFNDLILSPELAKRFWCLRQALLAFSKAVDLDCSADQDIEVQSFVNRMTRRFDPLKCPGWAYRRPEIREVFRIARHLLRQVLCDGDNLHASIAQWRDEPYGRHGPGAVAGGENAREKWQLHEDSRMAERLFCNHDLLSTVKHSSLRDDEEVAYVSRLAVVPKDVTKHRLICIEPKELMFAQQGLMKVLYDVISTSLFTKDAIHLFDQTHNFYSSRNRGCATIDLKDASDLLSLRVARLLFPREFLKLVTRYRSSAIELPGTAELLFDYEALATMGNALCFPLESLAFWSLSLAAILYSEVENMQYDSFAELHWVIANNPGPLLRTYSVRVFGDDIIIPSHYLDRVMDVLELAGLVVNHNKTCSSISPVRESCGSYWWGEHDVRVVKFTQVGSSTPTLFIGALTQLSQLREFGLTETANAISSALSEIQPFYDPERNSIPSAVKSGLLRFNPQLYRLEARTLALRDADDYVDLPGDVGLYAHFTDQATRTSVHSDAQRVKWTWVPICLSNSR